MLSWPKQDAARQRLRGGDTAPSVDARRAGCDTLVALNAGSANVYSVRAYVPLRPPDLASSWMSVNRAALVTPFTISYTVRPATAAAAFVGHMLQRLSAVSQQRHRACAPVSASISTPVGPTVSASVRMHTAAFWSSSDSRTLTQLANERSRSSASTRAGFDVTSPTCAAVHAPEVERVAQRDELRSQLGARHTGELGDDQHVALCVGVTCCLPQARAPGKHSTAGACRDAPFSACSQQQPGKLLVPAARGRTLTRCAAAKGETRSARRKFRQRAPVCAACCRRPPCVACPRRRRAKARRA